MDESEPVPDLASAIRDALRGDRSALDAVLKDVRQRADERAVDALMERSSRTRAEAPLPMHAPKAIAQPAPDRDVQIITADGRRVRARIAPAVARRRDVERIARASAENDRRAFRAITRQRRAIQDIRRSQQELSTTVKRMELRADRATVGLAQGITAGTRAQAERLRMNPATRRQQRLMEQQVNDMAVRAQIQNVTTIVNSIQTAAYADKGSVFSANNLLLAGNQLTWSLLEPALRRAGVLDRVTSMLAAVLSPVGSLLTGELLLGNKQHTRFISGISTVDLTTPHVESLRDRVADGFWPQFSGRNDVVVTATLLDAAPGVVPLAEIDQGSLRINSIVRGRSPLSRVRVAWMVDTGITGG